MNHVVRPDHLPRTTRAAEGLPRWRWTTAELLRLAELGAFNSDDHFELIGGEIVPMSPAGRLHEVLREDLENLLRSKKTDDVNVVAEPQFNLSDDTYTKTDILVRPASIRSPDLRGPTALLVVEIADTSLAYDLGMKADVYSVHGVREYWVVNARTLETKIHRDPATGGYRDVRDANASTMLVPLLVPALEVKLSDLDLD